MNNYDIILDKNNVFFLNSETISISKLFTIGCLKK